jgi:hypothetical protein
VCKFLLLATKTLIINNFYHTLLQHTPIQATKKGVGNIRFAALSEYTITNAAPKRRKHMSASQCFVESAFILQVHNFMAHNIA